MTPQNWTVKSLKEIISSLEAGVSVNSEDRCISGNEIGVLKVSSVTYGVFLPNEHKAIVKSEEQKVSTTPKKDRIIVSRANTPDFVGASVYIDRDYPNLFLSDKLWQLDVDPKLISIQWLSQVLNSSHVRAIVSSSATGSSKSMKNISQESFLKIKVRIPPIHEQKRLAEVLATWDEAIALTERAIEAKQKCKMALMQKLLTGKLRFHQFATERTEWLSGYFVDIAEIVMGQSPDGSTYNQQGIGVPLLNGPTEFGKRYPTKIQWTTSPTKLCKTGDILLCVRGSSTGRTNIANSDYCIGRGIAAIRAKSGKSITSYLEQNLIFGIQKILSLTSGSTFPNIDKKSIGQIPVVIPSVEEQKLIATVLSLADEEIQKLQQQVQQFQKQKQGLMQKLLTGEWRVSVQEAA